MKPNIVVLLISCLMFWPGSGWGGEAEIPASPDLSAIQVLDLPTAQQLALAGNPSMEAALARVEQAGARVRQASAAWWPSLDVTGSGGRSTLSDSAWQTTQALARFGGQSFDQTTEEYMAGIQASWLLFDGFYRKFNEEQAKYGEKSAAAGREDAQRLLVAAVAEAFLNAQLAQTNVGIAAADRDFYKQQLQDAQNRFDAGAGLWGDVLNIKVQLNSAQTSFLLSGREFEAAGYGLAALLGLADAQFPKHLSLKPLAQDADVSATAAPPDQLIEEALARRPDVQQLMLAIKQAEAGIGKAEAEFYPKLQLAGAVNGTRQGSFRLSGDDVGNTVALNLSWNLFAGGVDKARRFEAEQVRREASATLVNLRNQVAAEVRQDIALLEAAREQVILQRESVKLVAENRDMARSEYEAGQASLVRLNEAQRDLSTTHGRLAQAQVAWERARERLLAATGRNVQMTEDR
ncbi:MAG: TolC family protein [Desulfobulbaceae bacterium]